GMGGRPPGAALRRPRARPERARGPARRPPHRADAHRVPVARAVPAPPAPGPDPLADLRARLGLRLRPLVELARGLRRLPAAQDRGRGRTAPAAHRARRRLRAAPRGDVKLTLSRRLAAGAAAAVAFAIA